MIDVQRMPRADNSERGVLGAMLVDPRTIEWLSGNLGPEDFFANKRGRLFGFLVNWRSKGNEVDEMVLIDHFANLPDQGEQFGGIPQLSTLSGSLATTLRFEAQAKEVADAASRRRAIRTALEMAEAAVNPEVPMETLLATQAEALVGLQPISDRPWHTACQVSMEYDDDYEAMKSRGSAPGVLSGIKGWDGLMGGAMEDGWLIYVGGRPGMGKTAVALNIDMNLSSRGEVTIFFSLEMGRRGIRNRRLTAMSGVPLSRVRTMQYHQGEYEKVDGALNDMSNQRFIVDDTPVLKASQIVSRVKRIAAIHGPPAAVFVDYLQLIEAERPSSLREEITATSRVLKLGAKATECPWIVMSQLTREAEGIRPQMKHLRESGGIEADADVIVFPFRPNKDAGRQGGFPGGAPIGERDDVMELICGKHRHHISDTVHTVGWDGSTQRIYDQK